MTAEQRNSYRCQNIDLDQKAVIRVGQREVVAELINRSADGFSVTAKGSLRVREGKVLFVRTSAGWFQAQVIHKQMSGDQTTLGLVRLADLPDPRDAQLVKPGGRKLERTGSGSTSTGTLLLITIVAGLTFWGFLLNFTWFRGSDAGGRRVDLGAYLSRMIDQVTPNSKNASATGADAASAPAAADRPPRRQRSSP
ncbi:MAG: hypothetical protein O3C40_15585 [Planctomycetota bacterium]|nr:hypothetical protein [Planctomycetota bacterium]